MEGEFYSHGKLLLSAEYLVLDGALALAIPTAFGQSMKVKKIAAPMLRWNSLDAHGHSWFQAEIPTAEITQSPSGKFVEGDHRQNLVQILKSLSSLNPELLKRSSGFDIETRLEFPRDWGLGSSSTLLANLATWAGVDAYSLLKKTFGGSGYDLACALVEHPIFYQLQANVALVKPANFNPVFQEELFFVHLNTKRNTRAAINAYRQQYHKNEEDLRFFSQLSTAMESVDNSQQFSELITLHENRLSGILGMATVKQQLFPDYPGALKSLGAWGGDFILAVGGKTEKQYFRDKGYSTLLDYQEMALKT